jgi:hypothetical protein
LTVVLDQPEPLIAAVAALAPPNFGALGEGEAHGHGFFVQSVSSVR